MAGIALLGVNLVASLGATAGGVVALARPQALTGSGIVAPGENFYARLYAARTIPFSLASGILPFLFHGQLVAIVLFIAAFIQAVDVAIGASVKKTFMIVGASLGTLIHLLCGVTLL